MQDLIGVVYDKVIGTGEECIELGMKLDEFVEETIAPLREILDEEVVETVKEMIYKVVYEAEKDGFRLGVHTTATFIAEALTGMKVTE